MTRWRDEDGCQSDAPLAMYNSQPGECDSLVKCDCFREVSAEGAIASSSFLSYGITTSKTHYDHSMNLLLCQEKKGDLSFIGLPWGSDWLFCACWYGQSVFCDDCVRGSSNIPLNMYERSGIVDWLVARV